MYFAQSGDGVTYAHKITTEDRRLDWSLPAAQLQRVVRIGGAWTTFGGDRFKVLSATALSSADSTAPESTTSVPEVPVVPGTVHGTAVTCGDGDALLLGTVQPQGRAPMDASSWVNGARPDGKVLGAEPTEDRDPRLGAGHDG